MGSESLRTSWCSRVECAPSKSAAYLVGVGVRVRVRVGVGVGVSVGVGVRVRVGVRVGVRVRVTRPARVGRSARGEASA